MFRRAVNRYAWQIGLVAVLLPILTHLVETLWHWPPGSKYALGVADPDVWLRLTLVRNWLAGGSWYDHSYAANAPYFNSTSPWTRPVDLVIALFTRLQFYPAGLSTKLLFTSFFLPLLWMGLTFAALAHGLRRLSAQPMALIMLAVLITTAPVMYNYMMPGNVDHHAPLSMLYCWVVVLSITHDWDRWRTPLLVGLLLALMLWISPEALLLIGATYGWLGLQWLLGQQRTRPLARLATVTAVASFAAIMIERRPSEWLVPVYDTISISHGFVLLLLAIACWLLLFARTHGMLVRAIGAAVAMGMVAGIIHHADPDFLQGPMVHVHPYIRDEFLPRISEASPLFRENLLEILAMLVQPLAALAIVITFARRRDSIIDPSKAVALTYFLAFGIALYVCQVRWFYYLSPLVALCIAPWFAALMEPDHPTIRQGWPATFMQGRSEHQQSLIRMPLMLGLIAMPIVLIILSADPVTKKAKISNKCHEDMRIMIQRGDLNEFGNGKPLTVFAPTDLGTEILFFTKHRIIASNYHRDGAAIKDVWQTQETESLGQVRYTFDQRKVDLLFLCPDKHASDAAALEKVYRGGILNPDWLEKQYVSDSGLSKHPPVIFLVK